MILVISRKFHVSPMAVVPMPVLAVVMLIDVSK